jgi:hypothetical protein
MISFNQSRRALLALFATAVVAMLAIPGIASAQNGVKCRCDYVTVVINDDLLCKLTLCWAVSQGGPIKCTTYGPGVKVRIPCFDGQSILVERCDGTTFDLLDPTIARCTNFKVTADCCARVCITTDANGCPLYDIHGVPCAYDGCP